MKTEERMVEMYVETQAADVPHQLADVSAKVRASYADAGFASSLKYQYSHSYRSYRYNPLRWLTGSSVLVHVWRAWFIYRF